MDPQSFSRAVDIQMETLLRQMYAEMDVKETMPLDKLAVANPDLYAQMRSAAEAAVEGAASSRDGGVGGGGGRSGGGRDGGGGGGDDSSSERLSLRSATGLGVGIYPDPDPQNKENKENKDKNVSGPFVNAFLAEAPVVVCLGRAEALLKQLLDTERRASSLSDAETLFNGNFQSFTLHFCSSVLFFFCLLVVVIFLAFRFI